MKSFLILVALFIVSLPELCKSPAYGNDQGKNFTGGYLLNAFQKLEGYQKESKTFYSTPALFNITSYNKPDEQIVFTTEKLNSHKYRIQLLAHFKYHSFEKFEKDRFVKYCNIKPNVTCWLTNHFKTIYPNK